MIRGTAMTRARPVSLACALLALSLSATGIAQGTASISGRVVAADGTPLRSARVEARSGGALYQTVSDSEGRFALGAPAGAWFVTVSKPGFLPHQAGERRPLRGGTPIQVTPGDRHELQLVLSPASVITGTVFDDYGDPVAGATVQAFGSGMRAGRRRLTRAIASDRTDDTGAFRLHSLPPGDYYVAAALRAGPVDDPSPAAAGLVTYYPGTTDTTEARRIGLALGERRSGISFALVSARPVRVSGVAVDSSGAPARDASIELRGAADLEVVARPFGNFGLAQADGSFTILNVPPGTYVLTARVDSPGRAIAETAFVPVRVGFEGLSGVTVATQPGATLAGTIAAQPGEPFSGPFAGSVVARPLRGIGEARTSAIDETGNFVLPALNGPFVLDVDNLPDGWMLHEIVLNGTDVTDRPIEFPGAGRLDAQMTITSQITGVQGVVRAEQPTLTAAVLVFPADPSKAFYLSRFVRSARPDGQGRFQIARLPPAEYLIVAVDGFDEDELRDPAVLDRLRSSATPLSIAAGDVKHVGTLQIADAAVVMDAGR